MRWVGIIVSVLIVFALPAAAVAETRPATEEEKVAMLATDGRRPECVRVTVSSISPGWASIVDSDSLEAVECPTEGTITIMRFDGRDALWHMADTGDLRDTSCADLDVPDSVGHELKVCEPLARARYLPCGTRDGVGDIALTQRPRFCNNAGFRTPNSTLWTLKHLRWSSWGGKRANAQGLKYYAKYYPGYSGRPVRVRAFALSTACGAYQPFYTRLQFTLPAWSMRSRPFGGGPWTTRRMPATRYVVSTYPPLCAEDAAHATVAVTIRECGNYGWIPEREATGWTSGPIDGAGIFNVTARGARCPVARRVVLRAYRGNPSGASSWRWRTWSCRNLKERYEYAMVRCTSDGRAVRWETAA